MATFEQFLLHCAGADRACIKETPQHEVVKLTSIGKSILITTFFSTVSFFYAIYVISNQMLIASILCIFWGAFIYNIDRYIVSSMMGVQHKFEEFTLFIPRLIIAILISFTIATPIELLIFKSEINEFLKLKEITEINNRIKAINEEKERVFSTLIKQRDNWSKQLTSLESGISKCGSEESRLRKLYLCERDGTCGTGKIGLGPEALEKKNLLLNVSKKCKSTRGRNSRVIKDLQKASLDNEKLITKKTEFYENQKLKVKPEVESTLSKSLLVRITTLSTLAKESITVYFAVLLVTLLILSMELMPLFIKFLSRNGVYENCLNCLKNEKIAGLRDKKIELNEEISFLRLEIERIIESSKKNGVKFSTDIQEYINELKKTSYYDIFSNNLNKILSEKKFSEEVESHIRNEIINYFLDQKPELKKSERFSFKISNKPKTLFAFFIILIAISGFLYMKTGDFDTVKYFLMLTIFSFNFFIFYKKYASNKVSEFPSIEGL